MCPRVAKISKHAVTHVLGDKAIERRDDFGDRAVIDVDQLAHILRIELRRQRSRADKITEHYSQLTAFGISLCRRISPDGSSVPCWHRRAERRNSIEQLAPVADCCHADLLEIL